VLEDVRNYVRAGIGAVTSQGADAIPGALVSRAQSLAEQFASFAAGFLEWSGEARQSLLTELKLLVAGQIQEMGLASQEELDRLRARVEELEAARRPSKPRRPRPKAAPKRSAAKSTKSSARKSAARKSSGTRTPSSGRRPRSSSPRRPSTSGASTG
jgi:hypothetical protein